MQDNLRKWKTGGLRSESVDRPFTDLIASERTPQRKRDIVNHPSLKPQLFMREIVRASLPLGEGRILDPFTGGGSTIAAAKNVGYESVGVEIDQHYYELAGAGIPLLATLYCGELQIKESMGNGSEATRWVQEQARIVGRPKGIEYTCWLGSETLCVQLTL